MVQVVPFRVVFGAGVDPGAVRFCTSGGRLATNLPLLSHRLQPSVQKYQTGVFVNR